MKQYKPLQDKLFSILVIEDNQGDFVLIERLLA